MGYSSFHEMSKWKLLLQKHADILDETQSCTAASNTSSVCILVQHFILFSIEHSMVSSRIKYRTHTDYGIDIYITKEKSTHEIISSPLLLFFFYYGTHTWQCPQE